MPRPHIVPPTPPKVTRPSDVDACHVTVTPQQSEQAGGCNACGRHITGDGPIHHPVTQIDLRSCSFRVCDTCLHELTFQLQLRLTEVLRKKG